MPMTREEAKLCAWETMLDAAEQTSGDPIYVAALEAKIEETRFMIYLESVVDNLDLSE